MLGYHSGEIIGTVKSENKKLAKNSKKLNQ